MHTLRVHVREPYEAYCGRLSHVPFGFRGLGRDGRYGNYAPGGTVAAFRPWFHARLEADPLYRADVEKLKGKRLACFCPRDRECHVDVIVEWLDRDEGLAPDGTKLTGAAYVKDLAERIRKGLPRGGT